MIEEISIHRVEDRRLIGSCGWYLLKFDFFSSHKSPDGVVNLSHIRIFFVIWIWVTSPGCSWLDGHKILFMEKNKNTVVAGSARFSHLPIDIIVYMKLLLVGNSSLLRKFVYNKPLGLCYTKLNQINFLHSQFLLHHVRMFLKWNACKHIWLLKGEKMIWT